METPKLTYGLFVMECGRVDVALCREGGTTKCFARIGAAAAEAARQFAEIMTLAERKVVRAYAGARPPAEQSIADYIGKFPPTVSRDIFPPDTVVLEFCTHDNPCEACMKEHGGVRPQASVG